MLTGAKAAGHNLVQVLVRGAVGKDVRRGGDPCEEPVLPACASHGVGRNVVGDRAGELVGAVESTDAGAQVRDAQRVGRRGARPRAGDPREPFEVEDHESRRELSNVRAARGGDGSPVIA